MTNVHFPTCMTKTGFLTSCSILINKPHVINKRLWGSKILHKLSYLTTEDRFHNVIKPPRISNDTTIEDFNKIFDTIGIKIKEEFVQDREESNLMFIIELLPKSFSEPHAFQMILLNKTESCIHFYDITPDGTVQNQCPLFDYSIKLEEGLIILNANCDPDEKSFNWLKDVVLPQFIKWGLESHEKQTNQGSLSLIDQEKYYIKYNDLKLKYGKEMVKIWPECTDPSKFVYEDIAIATYILLLWEDERKKLGSNDLQTFVDLGCGNGLLVYILALEGHKGVGIDVRKRNIWNIYPKQVQLQEKTVTPSDMNLFPETDWIIGNHSDELTPWIPVVSARSSYKCNFFLLPCCAYNFDGTKYQRRDSSKSQYTEYLEYIKSLCEDCGYKTDLDRLKIPSTKRICLVGRERKYSPDEFESNCKVVQSIISQNGSNVEEAKEWIKGFKAREPVERVRNCTQIDKMLIASIVKRITDYLLADNMPDVTWSPGRIVELYKLIQLIPQAELKSLKSECGGLQTMLKNNHQIFKVQSGKVQLRYPKTIEEVKQGKTKGNNVNIKQKPCWFYNNHPQGCPLSNDCCSFIHSIS